MRRNVLGIAVLLCGCGSSTPAPVVTPPIGASDSPYTAGISSLSEESLASANDAANAAASGEGAGTAGIAWASSTTLNCRQGTVTVVTTMVDPNTTLRTFRYVGCVVRGGVTWDGNQSVSVTNTGANTRTTTLVNALTETRASGGTLTITTDPNAPIVVTAVGNKQSLSVSRTLVSGTEQREQRDSSSTLLASYAVTFDSLVADETYAADPNTSGSFVLTQRVLTGAQSTHHVLLQLTSVNTFTALTATPPTCNCSFVSGKVEHQITWDDHSRTADLTRTFTACGVSTFTGTDSKATSAVSLSVTDTCS